MVHNTDFCSLHGQMIDSGGLQDFGLTADVVRGGVQYTHSVLDRIDDTLVRAGSDRLASLLELANLSAIVGNLFRRGLSDASGGLFVPNQPHTYPDLLASTPGVPNLEIKVALEGNKPKGHLVKPGAHLTLRYVLGDAAGGYVRGREARGDVVWIWEVRLGHLEQDHFNFSSTPGDSGKTAVINAAGMSALKLVFVDDAKCPYAATGRHRLEIAAALNSSKSLRGCSRDSPDSFGPRHR